MKELVDFGVPSVVFCLRIAVGLDLAPADFAALRRRPRLFLLGLAAPPILLPLLALGLVELLGPPHEVEVGLLLVAASPIGGISVTYSYLARAAVPLAVSLTALSCLLAPLTLPAVAELLERASGHPLNFEAPAGVLMLQVFGLLALPAGLGMALRAARPAAVERLRPGLQRLGFGALSLLVALVLAEDFPGFVGRFGSTAPLAALFVVGSFVTGALSARLATRDAGERFTLAAEFATRNLGVAVAIAVTLLGNVAFTYFATTYFLIELVLLFAATALRRGALAAPPAAR
jgi:BASS family bile acid:Na+ symporter